MIRQGIIALTLYFQGYKDVMLALLKSGSDPTVINSSGKSCLGLAASHNRFETFIEVGYFYHFTITFYQWFVLTNYQ